jgi:hypothetical protein
MASMLSFDRFKAGAGEGMEREQGNGWTGMGMDGEGYHRVLEGKGDVAHVGVAVEQQHDRLPFAPIHSSDHTRHRGMQRAI